jgi:hypothetical protein
MRNTRIAMMVDHVHRDAPPDFGVEVHRGEASNKTIQSNTDYTD